MPECVWVDVGEIVPFTEPIKPCGDTVRVRRIPVVLRKYKALVLVVFPQAKPLLILSCPVFAKELHGFEWEGDKAI